MPSCKWASLVSSFAIFSSLKVESTIWVRFARVRSFLGLLGRTLLAGCTRCRSGRCLTTPALARGIESFPAGIPHADGGKTNGTRLHVRVWREGGRRSSCYTALRPTRADMVGGRWRRCSSRTTTSIVPDLRGMGLSAHPDTGYTKKNQACRYRRCPWMRSRCRRADLVTHDIGNMVGFTRSRRRQAVPGAHHALGP